MVTALYIKGENYYSASGGTSGAVVALLDVKALPFGASVNDKNGNLVTTVSQGGQIYVRLIKDVSRLHVSWGKAANDNCLVNPESGVVQSSDKQTLARLTTTCSNDHMSRFVTLLIPKRKITRINEVTS